MAVVRTAYRALARHIKYFEAQRIPLTGVVSLPAVSADLATLSPLVSLQQAFRSPRYTLDGKLSKIWSSCKSIECATTSSIINF